MNAVNETTKSENDVQIAAKEKKPREKKNRMLFYRALRFILVPFVKLLWRTEIVNVENYENFGSGLIVCNHFSALDGIIPAPKMFKKELHVVIKTEAFDGTKIASWFLPKMGGIPVHRGEADVNAVKSILNVLKADKQLLIFPEGTRNKGDYRVMGEFKDGAARFAIKAKKPLLPIFYYRPHKMFRRNWLYIGKPFDLQEFYGDKPTEENKKRATAVVRAHMEETQTLCNAYVEAKLNKHGN